MSMKTVDPRKSAAVLVSQGTYVDGHCPDSVSGAHYWILDATREWTSPGVCRWCGAQRVFQNWLDTDFNRKGELRLW